jgi:hypothetical protein
MTLLELNTAIAGLIAFGPGGERAGIRALARTLRRGRERDGAVAWKARPCVPSQKRAEAGGGG